MYVNSTQFIISGIRAMFFFLIYWRNVRTLHASINNIHT